MQVGIREDIFEPLQGASEVGLFGLLPFPMLNRQSFAGYLTTQKVSWAGLGDS